MRNAIVLVALLSACASSRTANDAEVDAAADAGPADHGPVVSLAVGSGHACAARADGTVDCWGSNAFGALGDGSEVSRSTAAEVPGVDDALEVGAGLSSTCIRHRDLTVSCWGLLPNGGSMPTTVSSGRLRGIGDAVALSVNAFNACVVRRSGRVSCWGSNTAGQLGDGLLFHGTASMDWSAEPVDVLGIVDATHVVVGVEHACALDARGRTFCWGGGRQGALGVDPSTLTGCPETCSARPVAALEAPLAPLMIAAGLRHTCAVGSDFFPRCWGASTRGLLGGGTLAGDPACTDTIPCTVTPVRVDLADTVQLSASVSNHCARRRDGAVACWGLASTGLLGADPSGFPSCELVGSRDTCSPIPVTIPTVVDAIDVRVGGSAACAVREGGTSVVCWGSDGEGVLGDGIPAHGDVCSQGEALASCSLSPVAVSLP